MYICLNSLFIIDLRLSSLMNITKNSTQQKYKWKKSQKKTKQQKLIK